MFCSITKSINDDLFFPSQGPERNFALELYGPKSKCFEHAGSMWEERTCRQVRQWQHWGSGCYEYTCQNGRLNIIVRVFFLPFFFFFLFTVSLRFN